MRCLRVQYNGHEKLSSSSIVAIVDYNNRAQLEYAQTTNPRGGGGRTRAQQQRDIVRISLMLSLLLHSIHLTTTTASKWRG